MTTKNIYQRILGVMGKVAYIQKCDKKVNNQYRFVSHDQVNSVLHPILVEEGIAVIPTVVSLNQDGNRTAVCLKTEFINADNPSDKTESITWGYGIDGADKGPGKAVSYAYKYALLKTFCLETGDDPDNDNIEYKKEEKKEEEVLETTINPSQETALKILLNQCEPEYMNKFTNHYFKEFKLNSWRDITQKDYERVFSTLTKKLSNNENRTKEVAA